MLPGPRLTYPEKPASCDDNKIEVPVPIFTMSYGLSISNGLTITTTTRTMTETAYETGCPLPEYTTTAACSLPLKRAAAPTDTSEVHRRADPAWADDMKCPGGEGDSVLYYKRSHKPHQVQQVLDRLEATGLVYHAYTHSFPSIGEIFVYIEDLPRSLREKLNIMPGVGLRFHFLSTLDSRLMTFLPSGTTNGVAQYLSSTPIVPSKCGINHAGKSLLPLPSPQPPKTPNRSQYS